MSGETFGEIQTTKPFPTEMSSILLNENDVKNEKSVQPMLEPGTSYEVFRNHSTAVEVIVKDVINKGKKKPPDYDKGSQVELDKLHYELDNANRSLVKTKKGFQIVIREMRRQIDIANSREAETQAANLALKLEIEKLKILLDSKTKLLGKIKKQLAGIKRILKSIIKIICNAPEIPGSFEVSYDSEYEQFENGINNARARLTKKASDNSESFGAISKDCFLENKG